MKFNTIELGELAWEKMQGLLPAIVQDAKTNTVLMLGYMNQAALEQTLTTQWVTFYSRSKQRLWTKGEISGNKLQLIDINADCDQDTLLIRANPTGPVCHTGTPTCFKNTKISDWGFIKNLENVIANRQQSFSENSYTSQLFARGISRIAQKVGEEGVEVVLAAIEKDDQGLCDEAADLIFHLLVLLRARDLSISDVIATLKSRQNQVKDAKDFLEKVGVKP